MRGAYRGAKTFVKSTHRLSRTAWCPRPEVFCGGSSRAVALTKHRPTFAFRQLKTEPSNAGACVLSPKCPCQGTHERY